MPETPIASSLLTLQGCAVLVNVSHPCADQTRTRVWVRTGVPAPIQDRAFSPEPDVGAGKNQHNSPRVLDRRQGAPAGLVRSASRSRKPVVTPLFLPLISEPQILPSRHCQKCCLRPNRR
jgi:hypothetical protein